MLVFSIKQPTETVPSSSSENAYATIGEVMDYLKVSDRTTYQLAATKAIPAFKAGGSSELSQANIERGVQQESWAGLHVMYLSEISYPDLVREENNKCSD